MPPSARPGSLSTAGPNSAQPRPWAELQGDLAVVVGGKKGKMRPETTVLRMLRSWRLPFMKRPKPKGGGGERRGRGAVATNKEETEAYVGGCERVYGREKKHF
jgi:hypothetical protein